MRNLFTISDGLVSKNTEPTLSEMVNKFRIPS